MADKIKSLFDVFDIKSGSILGVFTGTIIILCIYVTFKQIDLPSGVVAAYLGVVAAKTGHSVMTKSKEEKKTNVPDNIVG